MHPEAAFLLLLAFFQCAGGVMLPSASLAPRTPTLVLSVLLVLNGILASLRALIEDGLTPQPLTRVEYALDVTTTEILVALILAWRAPRSVRRAFPILAILGVIHMTIAFAWPPMRAGLFDATLRAVPYYIALGASIFVLAGGNSPSRWVALALLPRAAYFVVGRAMAGPRAFATVPNSIDSVGYAILAIFAVGGLARLLAAPVSGPSRILTVSVVALGPINGVLGPLTHERGGPALNYLTLGLVRPLLICVGVAPSTVGRVTARAIISAAFAYAVSLGARIGLDMPGGASLLLGVGIGLFTFGLVEKLPAYARGRGPDRPQWQRILLALRGSEEKIDPGRGVDPRWTLRGLSERTELDLRRVSAFEKDMAENGERRLDEHYPEWRTLHPEAARGGPPILLERGEGKVAGTGNVRAFYRLTLLGRAFADQISHGDGRADAAFDEAFDGPKRDPGGTD